jgi:hypothetical protein
MHFTDTYIVWSKYIIHKIIILRIWHVLVSASPVELPAYIQVFAIPCSKEYCLRGTAVDSFCKNGTQCNWSKWSWMTLFNQK